MKCIKNKKHVFSSRLTEIIVVLLNLASGYKYTNMSNLY